MNIDYFEEDGKLCYVYYEEDWLDDRHFRTYSSSGKVPAHICKKGEEAVRKYVEKKIRADIKKQKTENEEFNRLYKKINVPISEDCEEKALKGKIIYSDEQEELVIRLEKPCRGEVLFLYGSRIRRNVWQEPAVSFTQEALEYAKKKLIEIYKKDKHRDIIELAKKLNKNN